MKKCPFCKNEIELNSTDCPICKMVLIEKIPSKKTTPNYSYTTQPKEKKTEHKTYNYKPRKKFSIPKFRIGIPNSPIGWAVSIIGTLALTAIFSYHGAPNPLPAPVPNPTEVINTNSSVNTTLPPKIPYNYLPNGTVLSRGFYPLKGEGIINISNGSGSDAVVKLITSNGQKAYSVYVRSNNSYSIKKINDGNYRVLFSFGSNWDETQKKFLVNPSAEAFDKNFDFSTYDTNDGDYVTTHYSTYDITLNPVLNGTAITNPIDPNEFNKY